MEHDLENTIKNMNCQNHYQETAKKIMLENIKCIPFNSKNGKKNLINNTIEWMKNAFDIDIDIYDFIGVITPKTFEEYVDYPWNNK